MPPPTPLLPDLPPDVVRLVLSHLGAADLGAVAVTCKSLAAVAGEDDLWAGVAARAGWAEPLVRARLGRHADRAAAIGDAAGAAYLAAHARGMRLTWRDRCRVSAGVACVECGAPTARRTLGSGGAPLAGLRLCHDCVAGVMAAAAVDGGGAGRAGGVLIPEHAALAALEAAAAPAHTTAATTARPAAAAAAAAAAALARLPYALDTPPWDNPAFAPVRLYKARAVRGLAAEVARGWRRRSAAGAREAEAEEAAAAEEEEEEVAGAAVGLARLGAVETKS